MVSANAKYWNLLTQAIGYNTPKAKKLAEKYSDIAKFFNGGESERRLCGLFNSVELNALSSVKLDSAVDIINRCNQLNYSIITIDDPEYPERLYNIYAPPAVLYVSGKLPDFDSKLSVGIVGTRRASLYGIENSYKIAYALAKYNTVVVSGGALGVDCASHRGVLAANGVTVCVRGCGINSHYLRDNERMREAITEKGAVISEYPPDEEPRGFYFPARNRIIAALSDGLLLIEAGKKSGSLITANLALEMGKDLFALLGNNSPKNEGSNSRIKEGTAIPVTDFMDILANYDCKNLSEDMVDFDNILLADIEAIPVKRSNKAASIPVLREKKENTAVKPPEKRAETKKPKAESSAPSQKPVHKKDIKLNGDAKLVYNYLSAEPVHIDKIAEDLGLPVNRVLCTLTLLEVQGLARSLQGRNFVLK